MLTFKKVQEIIDKTIQELSIKQKPEGLYEPIKYILSIGGKRLRPSLVLMAYSLYDNVYEKALYPALSIEIFHNFTLLHDDIMDQAAMRRNNPTVHEKWNPNTAILSGDAMSIMAYQYVARCEEKYVSPVLDIFSQTALEVCEGQQYDMEFEQRESVSIEEYIRMIELKTSVLIAASLKIGAVLGGAPEHDANLLYEFGRNIGIAFQIQDDFLDTYGDSNEFGKKIGNDIAANKKTYLWVKALELADKTMTDQLLSCLELKPQDTEEKIRKVKSLYDQLHIKEHTESTIQLFTGKAIHALEKVLVAEEKKKAILDLTHQLMRRTS